MKQRPVTIDYQKIIPSVRVVVLVENTTYRRNTRSEHGLAFWVESSDHRLLFDTGQSALLADNARALDIPLAAADAIVLSHGHFDHTGGLGAALAAAPEAEIYVHPHAFKPKFRKPAKGCETGAPGVDIGLEWFTESSLRERGNNIILTVHPTIIRERIGLTGAIPRRHAYEIATGFYNDDACQRPDPVPDDQALFFEVPEGLVLMLGCAHAGVVNTMEYVLELTGHDRFYCVMGGMHLEGASRGRLDRTLQAFHEFDVQWIGLAHCTGVRAVVEFWNTFPGRCFLCPVGTEMIFGKPIEVHIPPHDYQI